MKKKGKKFNIPALISAPAITALSAGIMGIGAIVKRKSVRGVKADYKTSVKRNVKTESCARSLTDDAMFAMIDTFERKMPYSGGHSRRVADISRRIGEKIGIKDLDGLGERKNIVTFSIDNTTATVNGVSETMDVPARLINDQTFVPLRFLSENLGCDVQWDETVSTAIVTTK